MKMNISFYFLFALFILSNTVGYAQNNYPNTNKKGWKSLFGKNLSIVPNARIIGGKIKKLDHKQSSRLFLEIE